MALFKLSMRNVWRQKSRNALVVIAVAFCFGFALATSAMAKGMSSSAIDFVGKGEGGQIYVSLDKRVQDNDGKFVRVSSLQDPENLVKQLSEGPDKIIDYNMRSVLYGQLSAPGSVDGDRSQTTLNGFRIKEIKQINEAYDLEEGSFDELFTTKDTVVIPRVHADRLGVKLGDDVLIQAQTYTGQPTVVNLKVVGIYLPKGEFASNYSFSSIDTANGVIGLKEGACTDIRLLYGSNDDIPYFTNNITKVLSKYYVANTESQSSIFNNTIMRNELVADDSVKQEWEGERFTISSIISWAGILYSASGFVWAGSIGILALILVITVIGLSNNFRMIIIERTREIGSMRAMGMQRSMVQRTFLIEGTVLLLAGLIIGLAFGTSLILVFGAIYFDVPSFTKIMFQGGHVHFVLDVPSFLVTTIVICATVLLASLFPARRASRVEPAEALREAN